MTEKSYERFLTPDWLEDSLDRADTMSEATPRWKVAAVVLFYMAVALIMVMVYVA